MSATATAATAAEGLRLAQLEVLKDQGWLVKNTFITDSPTCCSASHQRARSAPPAGSRRHADARQEDEGDQQQQQQQQEQKGCREGHPSSRKLDRLNSNDSTKWPADDETPSSAGTSESEDASSALFGLIKQECGFLRLEGYVMHETKKVGARGADGATETCMRLFCSGLPRVKRSRWLRPLLWLTSAALQRAGLETTMKSSGLFLRCPRTGCPLRLDFSAARVEGHAAGGGGARAAGGEQAGDACTL